MEPLEAVMIHNPIMLGRVFRKEFLEKINKRSANYYPNDDPFAYNFKRRFRSARKIPASFIRRDAEGGYVVLSQSVKRRYWKYDRTRFHYNVYKTRFGYWICNCTDFSYHTPKPCKHIIRVILYKNGFTKDYTKMSKRIQTIFEDEDNFLEDIIKLKP
jgi:hypothetical protein